MRDTHTSAFIKMVVIVNNSVHFKDNALHRNVHVQYMYMYSTCTTIVQNMLCELFRDLVYYKYIMIDSYMYLNT